MTAHSGDDKTKLADGQLSTPNNAIDTTTGTIQLKATFLNDNDALWPGEFVNARLRVDTLHQAVTVPLASIQHGPNGLFVYTVKPDSTVQEQAVQLAYQDDNIAVIGKGVSGGENVVLTGQSRLAPGTHVKSKQEERKNKPNVEEGRQKWPAMDDQRRYGVHHRIVQPAHTHEHLDAIHPSPDRDVAVDRGGCWRALSYFRYFPWHRCRMSSFLRSWCRRTILAPVRRRWLPRSPRRWKPNLARCCLA